MLTEGTVEEYVVGRFVGEPVSREIAQMTHRRTGGNALFMVNVVEHLVQQKLVVKEHGQWELKEGAVEASVPETPRHIIEKQIEGLREEEQRVLEVASVAGMEFAVAAVAAGMKSEAEKIEEVCEEAASKGHFLLKHLGK